MQQQPDNLLAYLDLARTALGATTDLALAQKLEINRASISQMRSGTLLPGDELMIRLAKVARQDEALALLQLNAWRTKDAGTRRVYERLVARVRKVAAAILIAIGISAIGGAPVSTQARTAPAQAATGPQGLYIMENICY